MTLMCFLNIITEKGFGTVKSATVEGDAGDHMVNKVVSVLLARLVTIRLTMVAVISAGLLWRTEGLGLPQLLTFTGTLLLCRGRQSIILAVGYCVSSHGLWAGRSCERQDARLLVFCHSSSSSPKFCSLLLPEDTSYMGKYGRWCQCWVAHHVRAMSWTFGYILKGVVQRHKGACQPFFNVFGSSVLCCASSVAFPFLCVFTTGCSWETDRVVNDGEVTPCRNDHRSWRPLCPWRRPSVDVGKGVGKPLRLPKKILVSLCCR